MASVQRIGGFLSMSPFAYIVRRLFATIPTFIGITLIGFLITNMSPGGPVEQQLQALRFSQDGASSGASDLRQIGVTEEVKKALEKQFGFDQPVHIRYWIWMQNLFTFEFGNSLILDEDVPVIDLILEKIPVSLRFGIFSFLITYLVCIPLGVVKALKDGSRFDFITSFIVFAGYAMPSILMAILLIVLFGGGSYWDIFPISGLRSDDWEQLSFWGKVQDEIMHMVLPMICYVMGNFASMTLLMKNSVIDEIHKEYVLTAKAKGLSNRVVYLKHALRNSLIPIATAFAGILGVFLSGSFLIEQIFGLDGIGRLGYTSVIARDYPVTLGILIIASLVILMSNIFRDVLYMLIDPRINFDQQTNSSSTRTPENWKITSKPQKSDRLQTLKKAGRTAKQILFFQWQFHPQTKAKWLRFQKRKSSWYSLIIVSSLFLLSLFSELLLNNQPFVFKYNQQYYFPLFTQYSPREFEIKNSFVVDYDDLLNNNPKAEWAIYPPVPHSPFHSYEEFQPPSAIHWLGTDQIGRDVLARLVYGFRTSMIYALSVWFLSFLLGTILGGMQGYFGGKIDFFLQRFTEIWTSIPGFYLLIILIAIFGQSLELLVILSTLFGWVGISDYMRAEFLRLRKQEFVQAAVAYGASSRYIMSRHILPNALTPLITFTPFTISAGITGIAILDYLGLGLQPPTPSWGELMKQALDNFSIAWWLPMTIIIAMFFTLLALVFINEGIRESFNPRKQ